MICAAETNEQLQELEGKLMPQLTVHNDAIQMNEELFNRIKVVYDKRHSTDLNPEQIRLVEKMYDSAVRQGALLKGEQKERLQKINEELSLLTVKFDNNLLAETNDFELELAAKECSELPQAVRNAAKVGNSENKFVFTLHKPSLIPFLTYSQNRELREKIYKAYLNRGNNENRYDNKDIINDIIRLRTEKANLLGYKSYSDYVISEQMAGSPKAVYALLEDIFAQAVEKAKARGTSPKVLYLRASASSIRAKNSKGSVLGEMLAALGCVNIADSDSSLLENLSMEHILMEDNTPMTTDIKLFFDKMFIE